MSELVPVVLCGGVGSRLWPLSREAYPKQFLDLTDCGQSMLQATLTRLEGLPGLVDPLVVCNQDHRFLVAEQLQAIGVQPETILLEPEARNTAPAIMLAALSLASERSDARLLILPADHQIRDTQRFQAAVRSAVDMTGQQRLVTFGIVPTHPETGFGYIESGDSLGGGAHAIARFAEKPDAETAAAYVDSGKYLWNSGMFVFECQQLISEMQAYEPDIVASCQRAIEAAVIDLDFTRVDAGEFSRCPVNSIDYALMERTNSGAVVPLDAGWNDVGSWSGLWDISDSDSDNNVAVGDVIVNDSRNNYLHSDSRLVAAVGIDNTVVVETADAVLVANMDCVQDVKKIVADLGARDRDESVSHTRVYRPWGNYESICVSERFQVKKIVVNPGQKLSLQKHHHRAEHWIVVKGTARVTCEEEVFTLREDQSTYIPLGHKHRLENPGKIPLELIEVQSGSYLGEDDIVRYDDVYGREK